MPRLRRAAATTACLRAQNRAHSKQLVKHKGVVRRVKKYPVKKQKGRDKKRKKERRMVKKNSAARKEVREGKRLRQLAAGLMRTKDGM